MYGVNGAEGKTISKRKLFFNVLFLVVFNPSATVGALRYY
jgi:hypothetical protein